MLINMFNPTFTPHLATLAWKMSLGMPKLITSLNGPLCAYLMRQNLIIKLVPYLRAMNVLATFQNDPRKFTDVRVLMVIFHVRIWKMCKKNLQNFFGGNMENPIFTDMRALTVIFQVRSWKMQKKIRQNIFFFFCDYERKKNGSLCAYLMRQNLHDWTRPRS